MGNFIGHCFSGIFVLLLSLWWMYKGFQQYIRSQLGNGNYEVKYSYTTRIRGKDVPLEQIIKTIFLFVLLLGEVIISKFAYWDEKGQLIGAGSIMHLSYYLIFFVHTVVDLCMKSGLKGFPDHMDFFTASLAFFWNGLSLYYHVQGRGNEDIEYAIHVMPTYAIYVTAFSLLLMPFLPTFYLLDLMRCWGLVVFGTWFINAGFILYKPELNKDSPRSDWDLHRPANVHFIHALLGFHISLAVVIVAIVYQITYRLVLREMRGHTYQKLNNNYQEESVNLMVKN